MTRTTVMIPSDLKVRASRYAKRRGISLGKLIRESLAAKVAEQREAARRDPLFADEAVFGGPVPSDLSKNHDRYLYGNED